jgi:ketosteroid isomerase-like protein
MPETPAEVVRLQFEAFVTGGVEAAAEYWHPQIDWRAVEGAADDVGVIKGKDRLRRYYADWVEMFEDLRADVVEVLFEEDDRVALQLRNSGRGRTSGVTTYGHYCVVCTVRDGQIMSGREYDGRETALAAVTAEQFP